MKSTKENLIEKIRNLRNKLPDNWRWHKCYEFSYLTPPYIRKHWALTAPNNKGGVHSLGLISHDCESANRNEFMKDDIPVQFVEQSLEIVDTLLDQIKELESELSALESSPDDKPSDQKQEAEERKEVVKTILDAWDKAESNIIKSSPDQKKTAEEINLRKLLTRFGYTLKTIIHNYYQTWKGEWQMDKVVNDFLKEEKLEDFASQVQSQEEVIDRPEIVCICGSGRFLKQMHEVEERLTLEGKIVLMIGVNTKDVARTKDMEQYKPMLDQLHLRKIDLSDKVFVVNVDGYIGESTRKEINYSEKHNKSIEYLESETIGKNKPMSLANNEIDYQKLRDINKPCLKGISCNLCSTIDEKQFHRCYDRYFVDMNKYPELNDGD